jgi:hypothetical protein
VKKHVSLVLVILILAAASIGVASTSEDVDHALSSYLDASLHDRYEEAYAHLSEGSQAGMSLEDYTHEKEDQIVIECNEFTKRTTFKVKDIDVDGDHATAEVEITEPDVRMILKDLIGVFVSWILDDDADKEKLDKEMEKKYSKGEIPMTTRTEYYHMVKERGTWKVDFRP